MLHLVFNGQTGVCLVRNPLLFVWPLVGALFAFLGHLEESIISGQEAEEELKEGVNSNQTRCGGSQKYSSILYTLLYN